MPSPTLALPRRPSLRAWQTSVIRHLGRPLFWALALLATGTWLAAGKAGSVHAALVVVGAGLGYALFRSRLSFAGAWRALLFERRGHGFRAQLGLLALLTVGLMPFLAAGEALGRLLSDVVRPVGVSLLAGAFLFGIGAQLASACSSGSLVALGAGKLRYLLVAVAMVIGATTGSAHMGWWESQPGWISFSMLRQWGPGPAIAGNLTLIGSLAALSVWLEPSRHGRLRPAARTREHGRWPTSVGVFLVAALCLATLLLAGRPWVVVSALPLWGAKTINALGLPWDVAFWDYWSSDVRMGALDASLWSDISTLMIAGLVLGTATAVASSGTFGLHWRMKGAEALSALAGGLLLGYGGVVGLGCNVGALLAGVSSGSVHGWAWLAAAFAGTAAGVLLKRLGACVLAGPRSWRGPAAQVARPEQ